MNNNILCPNCGHNFDVEGALSTKLEIEYKKKYELDLAKSNVSIQERMKELEEEKKHIAYQITQQDELIKTKLTEQLSIEKLKLEKIAHESVEEIIKGLEDENIKKTQENKKLKEKEVFLLRKERELDEYKEELILSSEKKLLEGQKKIEYNALEKQKHEYELKEREYEKQLQDNRKLIEEMQRKSLQKSMQLQGEVQELVLEELLRQEYPFDIINEVGKGTKGADCVHYVRDATQQNCGIIVYESKRTEKFLNSWIEKLKQDKFTSKADVAVLVTQAMPKDMDKFEIKDGVWICQLHEVKTLSFILREMLIQINLVKQTQQNKGDKMELLYDYLTSNDFAQNIKRIIENYDAMHNQLHSEKKAMIKIWAEREKHIELTQEAVATLFGSIKGIAGNVLDTSGILELNYTNIKIP